MTHVDRVIVQVEPHRDTVAIWFLAGRGDPQYVLRPGQESGEWVAHPTAPSFALPDPPSLRLPREALEQLIAEASDMLPPSRAVDRHLNDAMTVRDRLLAFIEKTGPA